MWNSFVFAFNCVAPIILITALGYLVKRLNLIKEEAWNALNKICFYVFIPILLFMSIYDSTGIESFPWAFLGYTALIIVLIFALGLLIVRFFVKDNRQKGVILQGFFRSNYAIIGIPLATAIGGDNALALASLVALVSIPIFNILGVISLSIFVKDEDNPRPIKNTIIKIVKNPLLIGVTLGIVFLLVRLIFKNNDISFRLKDITFLYTALKSLKNIATPLALFTLGGLFNFKKASGMKLKIILTTFARLVIVPLFAFVPAYFIFNFGASEYATMIALFASPVAVSSAVMAKEMDNDRDLANQLVIYTTIFSTFTIFIYIVILRGMGLVV